jgi:tetratricopeptide (TPR) repeat protein
MKAPLRPPAAPGARASRWTTAFAGIGLVLAALAVYANSFSGPFIFDDLLSIPQNPTIRSLLTSLVPLGGGVTVTGRPLLNLSFALNYALSGDHVWSYHALNLLIHICAGLTLFGVIRRTLRLRSGQALVGSVGAQACCAQHQGRSTPAPLQWDATLLAFAVALLWTLHPLQTESVTYIVQRAESMMGLFYLLTLYCFIRAVSSNCRAGSPNPASSTSTSPNGPATSAGPTASYLEFSGTKQTVWFVLSFLSCLLGMTTKEVTVSAPVIVLLYDRTFLAGSFRAALRRRVHLALAATWIPLAGLVLHTANRGGTAGFGVGVSFWSYAATQFQALAHYLWLSVWPHPLIVDYGVRWVASVGDVAPYAAVVAVLVAGTLVALVRRPALGFLGAWFFAILAPTSLVPGTRQTLAEHRMYLALAPVMVVLVLALAAWLGRRGRFVLAAAAVGLGWLTIQRNTVYHSDAAIWRDTVIKRPGNVAARNNYGNILSQAGRPGEALAQYDEAMRLKPDDAEAYYNAGNTLTRLGRLPEAIARYEQALRANPNMPDAQTALGLALEDAGREDEAVAHYEQALRLNPNYADADNDLGLALARAGRLPEAIAHYEQALRINPALPDVHDNLGNALRAAGRGDEAIAHYEQALRLKPDYAAAHNNLGNAFREADRQPEAIAQYEQALQIDPAVPEVHNNLGISLLIVGRTPEAIAQFEEALRLDPNLAQVHLNLAIALESAGRSNEAAVQFEAARRLGATVPPQPEPSGHNR